MQRTINGRMLALVLGDISAQEADAIVNAANSVGWGRRCGRCDSPGWRAGDHGRNAAALPRRLPDGLGRDQLWRRAAGAR